MPASQTASAPTEPKAVHRGHALDQDYNQTCPACRAADKARSDMNVRALEGKNLDLYTFLIPTPEHCSRVCRAYLAHKYPDAQWIGSSLDLAKVSGWEPGEQIVVLRRDCWPRPSFIPVQRRKKDAEDKWEWVDVELEELMTEVVECAPIDVRKCIEISRADRFTKSRLDYRPLIKKLSELMVEPYRIDLPKHEDDTELRMVAQ